jgi:hypothetical protein
MTLDEYLHDKNAQAVALFERFAELVDACGESELVVRKSIVYWRRSRIWAGAFCNGRRLELNIDLLREVDHPLTLAVVPHTARVLTHRLRVTGSEQLDASLAALLHEAYETVGPGTRGAPAR